ncbi:MAG: CpsD/CapB family tyrosine-protein kinase, partial [Planctomycetota bacterium]
PGTLDSPIAEAGESLLLLDVGALAARAKKKARELEVLDQQIESVKREQDAKGDLAKEIAQIGDQLSRERKVYNQVEARLEALEMEQKAPGRISVASKAVAPAQPFRDRRFLLTAMALCGAMMTGLVVAHLRSSVNPKICEAGDVQRAVQVPFLGQLPPMSTNGSSDGSCDRITKESMRMVRTALLERLGGAEDRVVLITSSSGQVGKTSVAIGLAKSMAHLGKKTLLVEADLRRPVLSERLGLGTNAGLAAVLAGAATDTQVIVSGGIPRLDVLPAGDQAEKFDSELLANGVFAAYLRRWRNSYDLILLDSPPVLPVADARILAGQADGTIMVLRSSHSRRSDVVQAYADLSAAGGRLLGTILVGVRDESRYGNYNTDRQTSSGSSFALRDKTAVQQDA